MIETSGKKGSYAVAGLATLLLAFQYAVYASGFCASSGDDFFRALTTYEWALAPGVSAPSSLPAISVLWFPTHFWITGLLYKLTGHLGFSMMLVSGVAAVAGLVLLFHLTATLFDRRSGYIAMILAGLLPIYIWLGLSMTEMSLYCTSVLGGFLLFAMWQTRGSARFAVGASVLFLTATMLRPGGWIFAGIFSLYVCGTIVTGGRRLPNRTALFAAAIIPGLFIAFWLARNAWTYGNPIYFLQYSKNITEEHFKAHELSAWVKAVKYPFFMAIISPALFALTAWGFLRNVRHLNGAQWRHTAFAGLQLLAMILAAVWGVGTKAFPQRYVLATVLLLVPFAAKAISQWMASGRRARGLATAILMLYIALHSYKAFQYPRQFSDTVAAAKYLNAQSALLDEGSGTICSELVFRRLCGEHLEAERDFLMLASAHIALLVHSRGPDDVTFAKDILEEKLSMLAPRDDSEMVVPQAVDIAPLLDQHRVSYLVLSRRESMAKLPPEFRIERTFGTVAVFSRNPGTAGAIEAKTNIKPQSVSVQLADGIVLGGFRYGRGPFPSRIHLQWKLNGPSATDLGRSLVLKFTHTSSTDVTFRREVPPIYRWCEKDSLGEGLTLNEALTLFLPEGVPPGEYAVQIALTPAPSDSAAEAPTPVAELPPVTLIHSKREVIASFLHGDQHAAGLVPKVLLSL